MRREARCSRRVDGKALRDTSGAYIFAWFSSQKQCYYSSPCSKFEPGFKLLDGLTGLCTRRRVPVFKAKRTKGSTWEDRGRQRRCICGGSFEDETWPWVLRHACAGDMGRVWGVEGRKGGRVAGWCGVESGDGRSSRLRSDLRHGLVWAPGVALRRRHRLPFCPVLSCPVLCQRWRLRCRCACCATLAPTTLSRRCSRQRASGPRATRIVRARSVVVVGGGGWPTASGCRPLGVRYESIRRSSSRATSVRLSVCLPALVAALVATITRP